MARHQIHITDIKPGMVLKAVSANGTRTRRVHKVVMYGNYNSIWSIPVYFKDGDWEEECMMTSNSPNKLGWLVEIVNGKPVELRIEIIE